MDPRDVKINYMLVAMAREIFKQHEASKTGDQGRLLPDESFITTTEKMQIALAHEISDALDSGMDIKDIAKSKGLTEFDTFVAVNRVRQIDIMNNKEKIEFEE